MDYIGINFKHLSRDMSELLIAMLSEMHYEGFEEQPEQLKAFIPREMFDKEMLDALAGRLQFSYIIEELPDKNWNAVWESNFQPVIIGGCALRAAFHQPINNVRHEIIITPKMSFGTGHHATTFMMVMQMQDIDFKDKHVLDFGTGTGILAILAHKLGAAKVIAIDNDSFSIENAAENFINNNVADIELRMADKAQAEGQFDIILANITRNIIQENFWLFNRQLFDEGKLLISGLLSVDKDAIISFAANESFELEKELQKENWICLLFVKTDAYLF